jgi:hypothetical protein
MSRSAEIYSRGDSKTVQRSRRGIQAQLMGEVYKTILKKSNEHRSHMESEETREAETRHKEHRVQIKTSRTLEDSCDEMELFRPLEDLKQVLSSFLQKTSTFYSSTR